MNIAIVGLQGSSKTLLAKHLAEEFGFKHIKRVCELRGDNILDYQDGPIPEGVADLTIYLWKPEHGDLLAYARPGFMVRTDLVSMMDESDRSAVALVASTYLM